MAGTGRILCGRIPASAAGEPGLGPARTKDSADVLLAVGATSLTRQANPSVTCRRPSLGRDDQSVGAKSIWGRFAELQWV